MNFYLLFLVLISLIGIEFCFRKFNRDYLSKENTSCIKGIFVLIVFFSHFITYTKINTSKDFLMLDLRNFLGQLMVTLFLFYSGYGVYESIKSKKKDYVDRIPKNRIFKTWFHFSIAIFSFFIMNLFLNNSFYKKDILFSFTGWTSIGNSNWYIFSVLVLYLITYASFKIFDDKKEHKNALVLTWFLTFIVTLFLSRYKPFHYYNTLFCFPFGLTFSYQKEKIETILFNKKKFIFSLILTLFCFFTLRIYSGSNYLYYEFYSILFCMLVIELTMLVNLKSNILKWFGDHLFWFYILQRIPMIVLQKTSISNHPYQFLVIAFLITVFLTAIYSILVNKLDSFLFREKKKI